MKIIPLSDHILIEPIESEIKTKSGMELPSSANKEKVERGKVIAVGPGKMENDKRILINIKPGNIVLFAQYTLSEFKVDNINYLIAKDTDILAILE